MSLDLTAVVQHRLDVSLTVAAHEVVAVLGPNGAGKSTLLSVVAGLLRPDSGSARLDGRCLFDVGATGRQTWVPAHARGVALLAQQPLLFPHLTVLDNVAFGPRSTGASRTAARQVAARWLEEVDAGALAGRRPAQLSGGQAQRVAVGRALAAEPRLLLLDEPMAALDVGVSPVLRQMLRRVLRDRSALIVTHDALDALLLADRVMVVERGRVLESGTTKEVLSRPRSRFAAQIAGLNMVRGTFDGGGVRDGRGRSVEGRVESSVTLGEAAVAVFRPGAVAVFLEPPGGSPRNCFAVTVTELEPLGDRFRVRAADLSADVTAAAIADLGLAPGSRVFFVVKANEVEIYPA
jgi:molybdate transport system ATP-binding protein